MDNLALAARADTAKPVVPLIVDLDGTLLKTDLLLESFFALISGKPSALLKIPVWLAQGKAVLKARLTAESDLPLFNPPVNEAVLHRVKAEAASGRPVYLATASNERFARQIAENLGCFQGVFASTEDVNLKGQAKADRLVAEFGAQGFDYIGDAPVDWPIWMQARRAIFSGNASGLYKKLQAAHADVERLPSTKPTLAVYARASRLHQWAKNFLLFLPLLAAHAFTVESFFRLVIAFFAFSLVASAVYLVNDLLDLRHDRAHPRKRLRPLARGDLSLWTASFLSPFLFLAGLSLAAMLSAVFLGILVSYALLTFAYSFYLKRKPIVDVITLAGLYTMRVVAGASAVSLPISPWMLGFCLFMFLSLALIKRYTELKTRADEGLGDPTGRGYRLDDMPALFTLAGAAGYAAVIVLALYAFSPATATLYAYPDALWLVCCLLLYWISRAMFLAHRGAMHDDPVVFAFKDRTSVMTGVLGVAIIIFSSL